MIVSPILSSALMRAASLGPGNVTRQRTALMEQMKKVVYVSLKRSSSQTGAQLPRTPKSKGPSSSFLWLRLHEHKLGPFLAVIL